MSQPPPHRHPAVLVAPAITFAAVAGLLVLARVYNHSPVQAPPCQFKVRLGIPCLSCGGTRSFQALAHGDVIQATLLNPAAVLGVFASAIWLILGIRRYCRGASALSVEQQNQKIKRNALVTVGLLILNWIYLIIFLK